MSEERWGTCPRHGRVVIDYGPDGHIADDGPTTGTGSGHAAGCYGDCENHGCPVPVPVQLDPRYPCGPVEPDDEQCEACEAWLRDYANQPKCPEHAFADER